MQTIVVVFISLDLNALPAWDGREKKNKKNTNIFDPDKVQRKSDWTKRLFRDKVKGVSVCQRMFDLVWIAFILDVAQSGFTISLYKETKGKSEMKFQSLVKYLMIVWIILKRQVQQTEPPALIVITFNTQKTMFLIIFSEHQPGGSDVFS